MKNDDDDTQYLQQQYNVPGNSRLRTPAFDSLIKSRHIGSLVNKANLGHNFSSYVYFFSVHVSGDCVPIIRRNNCIYVTLGIWHSVWMTVWYAGWNETISSHPAYQTVSHRSPTCFGHIYWPYSGSHTQRCCNLELPHVVKKGLDWVQSSLNQCNVWPPDDEHNNAWNMYRIVILYEYRYLLKLKFFSPTNAHFIKHIKC
jgi:hypothetical protein